MVVLAACYILSVDAYFSGEMYGIAESAFALTSYGSFMREATVNNAGGTIAIWAEH